MRALRREASPSASLQRSWVFCRQRGGGRARVPRCWAQRRASGLRSQHTAPGHPWDPRWSGRDGEAAGKALERLIWDPGDTSQQRKTRDGRFAAKALGGEPQAAAQHAQQRKDGLNFSLRRRKGSMTSSVLSPPNQGAAGWGSPSGATRSPSPGGASPGRPSEAKGHKDIGDTALMSPEAPLGWED